MPKLLTSKAAAEKLSISPSTLAKWRSTGQHKIPYLKFGSNQRAEVRYRETELDQWVEQHLIGGRS